MIAYLGLVAWNHGGSRIRDGSIRPIFYQFLRWTEHVIFWLGGQPKLTDQHE